MGSKQNSEPQAQGVSGTDELDVATSERIQELRDEVLRVRSKEIDRWLSALAVLFTAIGAVFVAGGFLGIQRLADMEGDIRAEFASMQEEREAMRKERGETREEREEMRKELEAARQLFQALEANVQTSKLVLDEIRAFADETKAELEEQEEAKREGSTMGAEDGETEKRQIVTISEALSMEYQPFGALETGSVGSGGTASFTMELRGNLSYRIVGVCDDNCTDVDLILYDASERIVSEDVLIDDLPILDYTPTDDDTFRVEVVIVSCQPESCGWAVQAYEARESE